MAADSLGTDEKREAPALLIPTTIAKALIQIQSTLQPMVKSASNDAFGSSYVPLEDVMLKAHQLLSAHKIGVIQSPITDETGHAALETILFTGGGQSFSRTTKLAMNKVDPQAHGSAITYTRRYALMAILGLTGVGEDDDGNKATGVVVPVSQEQKDRIKALATALKHPPQAIQQQLLNVKTYDHAALAITNLEKQVSMRVRDDESKANAAEAEAEAAGTKIAVGTGDIEAPADDTDPLSQAGLQRRITALGLAGKKYENKLIVAATKKPWLSKVVDEADIKALDAFLKYYESGTQRFEADWYAPTKEPILVDEKVA